MAKNSRNTLPINNEHNQIPFPSTSTPQNTPIAQDSNEDRTDDKSESLCPLEQIIAAEL
jgi:hypothetical protein